MRWEDWLELLVSSDGKSVLCGNRSNVALEAFDAYLTNFAVSAALIQQGEEPLHATVVEIGDRAVGLVGPSGTGKSTLAAHLINRGWDLVTDDMLRITFEGNTAFAHPGPCRLKLFKEPAERYLKTAACCGPFNPAHGQVGNPLNEKLIFQLRDDAAVRSARRLSALFHLDQPSQDSEPSRISMALLAGQDVFRTILSSTINSRHNSPARLQRHFHFAERLVRTIPVYRLTYRRDYDVLNSVSRPNLPRRFAMKELRAFVHLTHRDQRLLLEAFITLAACRVRLRAQNIEKLQGWATRAGNTDCRRGSYCLGGRGRIKKNARGDLPMPCTSPSAAAGKKRAWLGTENRCREE